MRQRLGPLRRTSFVGPGAVAPALLLLFAALAFALPTSLHAQSAAAWNSRGQKAELREDYDAAFEAYRNAVQKKPDDLRYKARFERMRFQAAASHVDRGRVLRQNGDLNGALAEFTRALQIDPGDEAASQEIELTQRQGAQGAAAPNALSGAGSATAEQKAALNEIGEMAAPLTLQPVSNEPITIHAVEDVKNIYQAIGKEAGLNVLFDPDYTSKRIPVDLTNVSLSDALRIVGTIAGTFYKPVTANTIFVAANNRTKRGELDELAVQTFYLTNASQANDANEITTAIRNLLPADDKIYLVPSQNAIVIRATPDHLLLAQKLLNDLDRAKAEVVVDVAILQVNRDRIRNLGITLPQSFGLTPQASCTTNTGCTSTSSTSTTTSTTTSTSASGFTLNSLSNLNATNFAVTISGGTLNALLTDSNTRVLQNPRIRATDGQRATLKIGSKIPTATGSYSAGAATGVTAGIGVQTQFTYLDIGVNIDMTPTVHYDRDVSLKMKIEVSTQTGSVTISGVTEPIIGQNVSEQTIQLREGEPSILAGLFTKSDTYNNSGTPGLAEIPLLKYFFGSQYKENQQDEIIFLLIPHIVRESVLTRLNTRAVDTGTGSNIDIRLDPSLSTTATTTTPVNPAATPEPGTPTTAANAAAAMALQMKAQASPPTLPPAGAAAQAAAQAAAKLPPPPPVVSTVVTPVTLSVQPGNSSQTVGSTFQVAVMATNAKDLYSVPLEIQFDPKVLHLVNVDAGDLLARDGQPVALVHRDQGDGTVTVTSSRPPGVAGITGQGAVCLLTFQAAAAGDSNISLVRVGAKDSKQGNLPVTGSQAVVHVK